MEPPRATVIVPLYIWPRTTADWQPLHESILQHPAVEFLVIINPNSGPGSTSRPGHDYEREVPKLTAMPNVTTIGYVRVDYGRRPLHDVCEDIDRYAGWVTAHGTDVSGLHVHGIYLDETPNHFSVGRMLYLEGLYRHIKGKDGLLAQRLVVHNPGTPPDFKLAHPGIVDMIVTCEEPFERYAGREVQERLTEYAFHRSRAGYQISAVPYERIKEVTRELRHRGAYIFVTSLVDSFYESFGDSWESFLGTMELKSAE